MTTIAQQVSSLRYPGYRYDSVQDNAANGLSIDYALDDVGNVVGLDERQVSGAMAARTVAYDRLDRLSALNNGASTVQSFTYNATGNRQSKTTASTVNYTYPAGSHHLTKVGTQNRVYDAAGNSTSLHTKHFTYDDYSRMRQFINGSTLRNQYRYNGRGERIAKINVTSPASTLYYVYDEAGRLLGEYNSSGVAQKEYLWLDDTLVAILGTYQGHKVQYVLTDHLGTPRAVVLPATNTIIWRWDLTVSAFGDHAVQPNPDGDGANYTLHLRYPGQYYDGESGLHYNYFRDYDPATGRYVQSDPIGMAGGIATYSYANQSALRYLDPEGLSAFSFNPWRQLRLAVERGSQTTTIADIVDARSVTGTIGGSAQIGPRYWSIESGAMIDSRGSTCFVSNTCTGLGKPALFGGVGVGVGSSEEYACNSSSDSMGFYRAGGRGVFADVQALRNEAGWSVSRGLTGPGAGLPGASSSYGVLKCQTVVICSL